MLCECAPDSGFLSTRRESLGKERRLQVVAAPCRLLRIRSAALRARLHGLGSLRMKRVGIAERTFRCVGETVFGWGNFVWVKRCLGSRGEHDGSRREDDIGFAKSVILFDHS